MATYRLKLTVKAKLSGAVELVEHRNINVTARSVSGNWQVNHLKPLQAYQGHLAAENILTADTARYSFSFETFGEDRHELSYVIVTV